MFAIAVTDGHWFRNLRWMKITNQVNFWNPRPWNVRGLAPGQRWYFKLRQEGDVIAGYGKYVTYEEKSLSEAWLSYGEGNGCKTIDDLRQKRKLWGRGNFGDVRSQSALRRDGSLVCEFARDIEAQDLKRRRKAVVTVNLQPGSRQQAATIAGK